MKFISLVVLFFTFSALADETCRSTFYDFTITDSYIQIHGPGENLRIPFDGVRTISRRNISNFKEMVKTLSDEISTDGVLTKPEAALIERFTLTVADENEELVSAMYVKAYNKSSMIVARYMITGGNSFRCL